MSVATSHPATLLRKAAKASMLPAGMASRRRPGDVAILLYHRLGLTRREIELDPKAFGSQMAMLADRYPPISLDEALNSAGRGGVVVTFDDGYQDFYREVLPRLVKYRIPAILYLATSLVAQDQDAVSTSSPSPLRWSDLEEAVSTGLVEVGAHTHSHANLARADEGDAFEEMLRSKEMIEERIGKSCRHFAYPWGVASAGAERAARRLFDTAALGWGTNRHELIDSHRLGRTPVLRSDGTLFFRAKVAGVLDAEAHLYRAARRGPWRRS